MPTVLIGALFFFFFYIRLYYPTPFTIIYTRFSSSTSTASTINYNNNTSKIKSSRRLQARRQADKWQLI
jgi:hypothetical protein